MPSVTARCQRPQPLSPSVRRVVAVRTLCFKTRSFGMAFHVAGRRRSMRQCRLWIWTFELTPREIAVVTYVHSTDPEHSGAVGFLGFTLKVS